MILSLMVLPLTMPKVLDGDRKKSMVLWKLSNVSGKLSNVGRRLFF